MSDSATPSAKVSHTFRVPATLDQLEAISESMHAELRRCQCPVAVRRKLDVALEEMLVNVCHYAYANQDEPGIMEVVLEADADVPSLRVTISDSGVPFNPLTRKDPTKPSSIQETKVGGLGIFMTKKSVDELTYDYVNGQNVVSFVRSW